MKKLISGILCTALAATCLCGCGKSFDDEKDSSSKEKFYLLTEYVEKNDAGEVMHRGIYEYNARGLVISEAVDLSETEEEPIYDAERDVFEFQRLPCDGKIDWESHFVYDRWGNVTCKDQKERNGEFYEYEYTYDKDGKVTGLYTYYYDSEGIRQMNGCMELEYKVDGTIELWSTRNEEPIILQCWETSENQVKKLKQYMAERGQWLFEYDDRGNMTEVCVTIPGEPDSVGTRTYDQKGRVTSEQGFRYKEDLITYEYDGDKLVSISGEPLEYKKKNNGKVIVNYMEYELTYEVVELTKEEAELARYRWNQFCGGLRAPHRAAMSEYGVQYPVFCANTVLLLPRVING